MRESRKGDAGPVLQQVEIQQADVCNVQSLERGAGRRPGCRLCTFVYGRGRGGGGARCGGWAGHAGREGWSRRRRRRRRKTGGAFLLPQQHVVGGKLEWYRWSAVKLLGSTNGSVRGCEQR